MSWFPLLQESPSNLVPVDGNRWRFVIIWKCSFLRVHRQHECELSCSRLLWLLHVHHEQLAQRIGFHIYELCVELSSTAEIYWRILKDQSIHSWTSPANVSSLLPTLRSTKWFLDLQLSLCPTLLSGPSVCLAIGRPLGAGPSTAPLSTQGSWSVIPRELPRLPSSTPQMKPRQFHRTRVFPDASHHFPKPDATSVIAENAPASMCGHVWTGLFLGPCWSVIVKIMGRMQMHDSVYNELLKVEM